MSSFAHLPLGQRIPSSMHAVSCSLPTMRDVIGYEEKDPAVTRHMTSGYPRFVQHPYLKQAAARILKEAGLPGHQLWLTSSVQAAEALCAWLKPAPARVLQHERLTGAVFPADPDTFARAKTFLQHTGALLSSREAEDYLVRTGELAAAYPEVTFDGYPAGRIKGALSKAYPGASTDDIFIANSGMNAIYASFRTAQAFQQRRGRSVWIQLGWLYLDTIALLKKFSADPAQDYLFHPNVFDLAGLRKIFAIRGSEIAGIITEVPTNPLIQTPDLPAVHQLCREHGAVLIVDPTVVSPLNIEVLPYCDVAVNSLTKYAGSEGDIILGAAVVNPGSSFASEFRRSLPGALEPVYSRDLARLAAQMGDYEGVVARINEAAPRVVEFLLNHPRVTDVFWSGHPESRQHYAQLARSPAAVGGMISFSVTLPIERFYDRLRLPKGPSFGMKTTLICPFIYLAHYDLVTSTEGQAFLKANRLDPALLRLCIGCEPAEDIIEALAEALS